MARKKADDASVVRRRFVCEKAPQLIVLSGGNFLCRFRDGVLETDDQSVIQALERLADQYGIREV